MPEPISESQQLWEDTTQVVHDFGFRDIDHALAVLQAMPGSDSLVQHEAQAGEEPDQLHLNKPEAEHLGTSFLQVPGVVAAKRQPRLRPFSIRDLLEERQGNGEV